MVKIQQQFAISATSKYWGQLYLPDDYRTNSELCALMVFCHGIGERGGTEQSLDMLNQQGPMRYINDGRSMVFKNPVDGTSVRYAVLALQDPSWSPSPDEIAYCLRNEILYKFPINRRAVVITGLSAGGDSVLHSITNINTLDLFCAAIPMSPASSGNTNNCDKTIAAGIEVWGFSGDADGSFTANMNAFAGKMNALKAGSCRVHIYTGGHGGWENFYNPDYRSTIWGGSMNIYEFGLASAKASGWVPAPPPSSKVVAEFNLIDGTTVKSGTLDLDASASMNVRTDWQGYQWNLRPLKGGTWGYKWGENSNYGGPLKRLTGLGDGLYELSLTVMGNDKSINTKTVNFTVQIGDTEPAPVFKPTHTLVHPDGTKEVIQLIPA